MLPFHFSESASIQALTIVFAIVGLYLCFLGHRFFTFGKLTLYVHQAYFYIWYNSSMVIWCSLLKVSLKEDKDLCEVCAEWHGVGVLVIEYTKASGHCLNIKMSRCHYHVCWWAGDTKNSKHSIGQVCAEYFSPTRYGSARFPNLFRNGVLN